MPNNPPANPIPGAIYVDQITNLTWIWTGTVWLQASGAAGYNAQVGPGTTIVPGFYSEPSPESWIPTVSATAPLYPSCGQIWIDNSVIPNLSYVWDCDTGTHLPLGGGSTSASTTIVSTVAPTTRTDGNPLVIGDLWVDATTQVISYWDGVIWAPASSPDTNSIPSAGTPATRADGSALQAGDLWADMTNNLLYFYNGSSFVNIVAQSDDHQLASAAPTTSLGGATLSDGDRWTDSTTGNHYYYESGAWVPYNDTHSQVATVAPTVRETGDALRSGDQWFDTSVDALYVYDLATTSWKTVGGDTHSFVQSGQPTLTTRPNTEALLVGDMYVDSATNKVWYWSGAAWEIVSGDTHSFTGNGIPALALRPDGTPLEAGDQYLDLVGNNLYGYNGSGWVPFISPNTHAFTGSGTPTLTLRPDASPLIAGDEYIDITTDIGYYWNGTAWEILSRDLHSFTGLIAPTIIQRPDGNPLIEGDQYINKTTGDTYYWDSAAWVLIGGDTHSIRATAAPTTRTDGTPLRDGDQWVDTDNQNAFYVYNLGTGLWEILGDDTHSFAGAGSPTLTLRPNGQPLQSGDQWLDTSTFSLHGYDGATWNLIGPDTHSFFGAADPALTTRPDGTTLLVGDQFLNTTNKILFAWDGAAWNVISGDTHSMLGAGDPTVTNPTITRIDGSPLKDGDQYIDTVTNEAYFYTAGTASWAMFSSADTHSFTGNGAPILTVRPNGQPLLAGDQYVDEDSDVLYYYDSALSWVTLGGDTSEIIRATTSPTTRLNATALRLGDQWVDTDNNNVIYSYNGTAWEKASDDTHTIWSATAPTLNNDGLALKDGDLWANSTMDANGYHGLKVYHGTAWHEVGSIDTHSFTGVGAPVLTVRPSGEALLAGDQYLDSASKILYAWDGAAWVVISGDTHSITGVGEPVTVNPVTTRPDGSALKDGDHYVNTTLNEIWAYHNGAWNLLTTDDTHGFAGNGTPYIATPSVGTNPQATRQDNGRPLSDGDQYWDKNTNILYLFDVTTADWKEVSGDTHSITGAGEPIVANPVTTRTDGSALLEGDMYVDTATNYVYGYLSGAWVKLTSPDTHSFTGTGAPTLTVRPDASALLDGDQYIDIGTNKLWGFYSGGWLALGPDAHSFAGAGAPTLTQDPVDGLPLTGLDQYMDTTSKILYHYTAGQWEIMSPFYQSYTGNVDPSAAGSNVDAGNRPDGSVLVAGDQYVNTITDILFYWDGTVWKTFASSADTHSFTGTGVPTLTQRPDTTALLVGDQYIGDATNLLYYYNSTAWVLTSSDSHTFTGAADPVLTVRPNGSPLLTGDEYINTTTDVLFYYNGTAWETLNTVDTHSFSGAADPALTTRPDGEALVTGDQYINTTTDILFYWNGSAWEVLDNDTHSFVGTGVPAITARPDGTTLLIGDQFIDSVAKTLYYWGGAAWLPIEADTHSFTGTVEPSLAGSNVDAGNRPDGLPLLIGDQYVNLSTTPSDSFVLYVWDGTAWVLTSRDTHTFITVQDPTSTVLNTTRYDGTPIQDGDLAYETTNSVMYIRVAGSWQLMGVSRVNLTYNATNSVQIEPILVLTPTTQPDITIYQDSNASGRRFIQTATPPTTGNTASVNGDIWYDLNGNISIYDGGAWVDLTVDTHSFTGTVNPSAAGSLVDGGNRPDGSTLLTGDQYVNTTTDQLWFWDGATWTALSSSDTHSFIGNGLPTAVLPATGTQRPDTSALVDGDQYVDTSTNTIYYWNGTVWTTISGADTHSILYAGSPFSQTVTRLDGSPAQAGDMVVDETSGDIHYYNGTIWILLGPTEVQTTDLVTVGAFPTTRVNGVNVPLEGDVYIDSVSSRKFIYDTTLAYKPMGSHNFVQDAVPAALLTYERDIWIDTSSMQQYVYYNDGTTTQWTQIN